MKRIVLWLLSTLSAVVLLFGYHTSTSGSMASTAAQTPIGSTSQVTRTTTSGGTGGTGGTGGGSTAASAPTAASSSTVTGSVAQTRWGPVQVELTVQEGSITDVQVVQYPSGNHEDDQINSYALPILVDSTLEAQSADIDMVSGATVTSDGYVRSLQSALDQAGL